MQALPSHQAALQGLFLLGHVAIGFFSAQPGFPLILAKQLSSHDLSAKWKVEFTSLGDGGLFENSEKYRPIRSCQLVHVVSVVFYSVRLRWFLLVFRCVSCWRPTLHWTFAVQLECCRFICQVYVGEWPFRCVSLIVPACSGWCLFSFLGTTQLRSHLCVLELTFRLGTSRFVRVSRRHFLIGACHPSSVCGHACHPTKGPCSIKSQKANAPISRVADGPRPMREIILFSRYAKSPLLLSRTYLDRVIGCQLIELFSLSQGSRCQGLGQPASHELSLKQEIEGLETTRAQGSQETEAPESKPAPNPEEVLSDGEEEPQKRKAEGGQLQPAAKKRKEETEVAPSEYALSEYASGRPTCATVAMGTVAGVPSSVRCLLRPSKDPASSISIHEPMACRSPTAPTRSNHSCRRYERLHAWCHPRTPCNTSSATSELGRRPCVCLVHFAPIIEPYNLLYMYQRVLGTGGREAGHGGRRGLSGGDS